MLRVFKLSSPMNVGSWILSAYGPAAGAAALSDLTGILPAAGVAATAGAALLGPAVTTYTAVLLCDTAVPAWHEAHREMPYVFAGSAASAAGGFGLLAAPAREAEPARRLAIIGAAVELTAKKLLERRLQGRAEPYQTGRAGALLRAGEILTGCGLAGAGLSRRSRAGSAASGLALLAASALTRFGIFEAGRISARYPQYTIVPQRERRAGPGGRDKDRGRRRRGTDRPPVTQKNRAAREGQESGRRRIRWRKGRPREVALPIYALGDIEPEIDPAAFVHPDAVIIGSVRVAAEASVWPCAVLRGDHGTIEIGARTSIQDGTVVHCTHDWPTIIGAECVVGHNTHLEGCVVGDRCLIGSGSVTLNGAVVGDGALVGASALVPEGFKVPPGTMALGVPCRVRELTAPAGWIDPPMRAYLESARRYRTELRRMG